MIKVNSYTKDTMIEIGYIKGLKKALSLLRKQKNEIERHRSKCKIWKRAFPNPLGKYTTSIDFCIDFCPRCAFGAISHVIEPLESQLNRNIRKSDNE